MWLGKATIVNDPEGARDYIQHGEDGLLVPPNDPMAMRKAIMMLIECPEKAKEIGTKAMQTARKYSTDEHFRKLINVVHDVMKAKRKEVSAKPGEAHSSPP
jgi:glycosyltransferase involved in cell wall biosynthesis